LVIQSYEELAASDLVKNALTAPDSGRLPQLKSVYERGLSMARSAIHQRAAECGTTKVEPTSWFIAPELAGLHDRLDEINQLIGTPQK
jgi:hypothetical protein